MSMPILAHLEELRRRLFICAIAVLVGALVAYVIFTQIPGLDVLDYMARPAKEALGSELVFHGAMDIFKMSLNAGFVIALIVASPVIFYQLWAFVAPAMYAREKKVVIPVIFSAVSLFIIGVAIGFYLVVPMTLDFFLGFETGAAVPLLTLKEFISLEIWVCVGMGTAFQLPIVILILSAIGIVTPQMLKKFRRYAIVGVLIVSAAIMPDPTTMLLMWIPLYSLYEISILVSGMVYKWRQKRDSDDDDEEDEVVGIPSRAEPRRLDQLV